MITLQRLSADKGGSAAEAAYRYLAEVSSQASAEEQARAAIDEYYLADQSLQRWVSLGIAPGDALVADGARVTADDFLAVAGGRRPGKEGEALVPQSDKRSPGTDMTFAPSKGVSILWTASSEAERREIEAALHESSRAALDYALRQGWFTTRRGSGRQGTQVLEPVAGIQAASFLHTTSREGDPSLHQHTLIFNVARTADGQWRSLDFAEIFKHQKVISARFDAEIAYRLRERFGVSWNARGGNNIDVAGVSDALRDQFSKRNQQIDIALDHGHGTQKVRDIAWAETRGKKVDLPPPADLERRWAAELAGHVPTDDVLRHTVEPSSLAHAVAARRMRDQALRFTNPDLAKAVDDQIRAAIDQQPIDQSALIASSALHRAKLSPEKAQRLQGAVIAEVALANELAAFDNRTRQELSQSAARARLTVAARNDDRPDARFMAISGAD